MTGHRADRLAGLGVLLAGRSRAGLLVHGVPEPAMRALRAAGILIGGVGANGTRDRTPTPDAALVVLKPADDPQEVIAALPLPPGGRVVVLRRRGLPVRAPRGYRVVARFGCIGSADSPTHLVRIRGAGRRDARSWFGGVRPTWGVVANVARQVGRLPLVARWGFPVEATLLVRGGSAPVAGGPDRFSCDQIGPDLDGPAVIALGGGPTAGRTVLTYADDRGRPVRHVKLDIAARAAALLTEQSALERLVDLPGVPRPCAPFILGPAWVGVQQTHLDGPCIERRWASDGAAPWSTDVDAVLSWLTTVTLPRGLVHGDLWPSNVVYDGSRVGVFDWESAGPGDSLVDALSFLITAARTQRPYATLADAALAVFSPTGWAVGATSRRLAPFLNGLDASSDPARVEDRLLDQLTVIAERDAPGGNPDQQRQTEWLAARDAVAGAWRVEGSPWRPGPSTSSVAGVN